MAFTLNSFSVGFDFDLTIRDDQGNNVPWFVIGHGNDFSAQADDERIKVQPITNGGKPLYERIPGGWTGRVGFVRYNGSLVDMFAAMDFNFYTFGRRPKFTLFTTVQNRDGSTSQYIWTQAVIHRPNFGDIRAGKEIDNGFEFAAQECLSGSGLLPPLAST